MIGWHITLDWILNTHTTRVSLQRMHTEEIQRVQTLHRTDTSYSRFLRIQCSDFRSVVWCTVLLRSAVHQGGWLSGHASASSYTSTQWILSAAGLLQTSDLFRFPRVCVFFTLFSLNSCTLALKRFSRLEKKKNVAGYLGVGEGLQKSEIHRLSKVCCYCCLQSTFPVSAIFENVAMVVSLRKLSIIVKNKARGQEINQLYHL